VRYSLDHRRVHNNYKPGELLKLPKLGALKLKWSRTPNGIPKMVTVSQDSLSHYYVSFGVETVVSPLPQTDKMIGVDRGVKDVLVFSTGEKSGAPKLFRHYQRRLKLAQRVMSRRRKGSQRWHRARRRVANIQIKITACRLDFTHKATTKLVREAQVIALEKLNIKGMMKNRHLAKSIGDSSLYEVQRQIEYKATWYGRDVFFSDQWAPTSKTCSDCGSVQDSMALHVRRWVCPHCKAEHDRDSNAAKNVLTFATGGRPGSYARGGVQTPAGEVTKTPHQRTPVKREFAQLTN
jgi:putative transposase